MAWCPECKNEYREGVTVCKDCGCELVTEQQYDNLIPLIFGEEEQMSSLKKYFEYNELQGVVMRFCEEEEVYELLVCKEDKGQATAMAKVFLQQEAIAKQKEMQGKEMGDADSQVEAKQDSSTQSTIYLNNKERAEENRSSAWMLFLLGTVGLVIMALGIFQVLPLRLGNPYMFYGVMCTVFLLFIIMGVVSMKNAKIFAKKAESENTLRDAMTKWYQENLTAALIDSEISEAEDIGSEVLYFRRIQVLKEKLNHQFMNLDQAFLEHYIDEEVYDSVFADEE